MSPLLCFACLGEDRCCGGQGLRPDLQTRRPCRRGERTHDQNPKAGFRRRRCCRGGRGFHDLDGAGRAGGLHGFAFPAADADGRGEWRGARYICAILFFFSVFYVTSFFFFLVLFFICVSLERVTVVLHAGVAFYLLAQY